MDAAHDNDGYPDAWSKPGQSQVARYPNDQEATCLWYHDHAMGITARNVYAGLAGFYLLRDAYEHSLKLPAGAFEIPLMLQTRSFKADGTLDYPVTMASDEVYGDVAVVNGKAWPRLRVEPRRYRFRVLNAANARTFALRLADAQGAPGPAFVQIGSDDGFLARAVTLNEPADPQAPKLILAPGERADIIVDFSAVAGRSFILRNDSITDDPALENALPLVMQIQVKRQLGARDRSVIPAQWRPLPELDASMAAASHNIFLREESLPDQGVLMLLNGMRWTDPVTERCQAGSVEAWNLCNTTGELHPFHIHGAKFQVLDRQRLDADAYKRSGTVIPYGDPLPPDAGESGWKDTVRVPPRMLTRILLQLGPYAGRYVFHCHILEHEDMDMMRPFDITAAP